MLPLESAESKRNKAMLILTRRIGETILIGDDIKLTPLSITGGQVRIGIAAPAEIAVHREEIYRRIQMQATGTAESNVEVTVRRRRNVGPGIG